ncbi:Fe-S cluster assembly protein SufD [Aureimonas fodinaquatilis]|uniref:Fe-S cluster assembly protein SufD n=1 Tax=Aureimonas fodinaquatilis TaxID=2565783 RepID=A0A5B0DVP2_9HYPH|nr:Fe-S cluster assembly protein SufD [Aureimonas fodinaquatilis]KAA0970546.1 Fe-S cluster assembly protein SufD [Aureimonas fodinaquatilis]
MSLQTGKTRTPSELRLIEQAQAQNGNAAQRQALAALELEGLPNRRVEAWHYTDLRVLMDRALKAAPESAEAADALLSPLLPHSVVVNLGAENDSSHEGLTVTTSAIAPDWSRTFNHLDRDHDTIRVLNVALGSAGSEITVDAGVNFAQPVELRAIPRAAGSQAFARVNVGQGARAVFVERVPAAAAGSLSTAVSELVIQDDAEVLWIIDQEKAASESYLGQISISLGANSKLMLFLLSAGGGLVRQEVHCETVGEGADIQIRGVNLLAGSQHVDITTSLTHSVAHTTATEILRNVVMGGHGVFQGMIKVAKGAQKTDAKLACNSLLLSDEGDFSAKPELEIFADDVQCGHGATAGEIDADHLFYLMSRGIPEKEARALLVKAFVAEVVEDIDNEAIVEVLEERIDSWLSAN